MTTELPLEIQHTPDVWPLWLRRQQVMRLFNTMETAVRDAYGHAWNYSVHHSWLEEALDFVESGTTDPWRWRNAGDRLLAELKALRRQGNSLYSQEETRVRECAAWLRLCGRALAMLGAAEAREYRRMLKEAA